MQGTTRRGFLGGLLMLSAGLLGLRCGRDEPPALPPPRPDDPIGLGLADILARYDIELCERPDYGPHCFELMGRRVVRGQEWVNLDLVDLSDTRDPAQALRRLERSARALRLSLDRL